MLYLGVVEKYMGPWQSAVAVIPKPRGDSSALRLCVDLRDINNISVSIVYPLPIIVEIIQSLGRAKFFTKLDLAKGFWQIPVDFDFQCYLAFDTRRGTFKFVRMPFGRKNTPGVFQSMMNDILEDALYLKCFVYINDVVVFGNTQAKCIQNTKEVIQLIYNNNLKLGCSNCELLVQEVEVLGHLVEDGTPKPKVDKGQGLVDLKRPQTVTEAKSMYGLLIFFRKFIKNLSQKYRPITELFTMESVVWSDRCEKCLLQLVNVICTGGLALPVYGQDFILTTDFRYFGHGEVVSQVVGGIERPVILCLVC